MISESKRSLRTKESDTECLGAAEQHPLGCSGEARRGRRWKEAAGPGSDGGRGRGECLEAEARPAFAEQSKGHVPKPGLRAWSPGQPRRHRTGTYQKWTSLGLTQESGTLGEEPSEVCSTGPPGYCEARSSVRTTRLADRERRAASQEGSSPHTL